MYPRAQRYGATKNFAGLPNLAFPALTAPSFEGKSYLKTAKALGLNVPNSLIGRADELIE